MKYRSPLISGPSAPWVDEDDLPQAEYTFTIDGAASLLASRLRERAESLESRPTWDIVMEEIRCQLASASVRNDCLSVIDLSDLMMEVLNIPQQQAPVESTQTVPWPLPWEQEDTDQE